jgi:hypothetical protein
MLKYLAKTKAVFIGTAVISIFIEILYVNNSTKAVGLSSGRVTN